ncbi:MAG: alpha/beta hydrolase [Thermoleophilaceae bacterium]
MSEQFCDIGRGIVLCYEAFGEPTDPPILLIMGLATQMVGWPDDFCRQLADRGFYVVRFDNRDAGRSTHIDGTPPSVAALLLRRRGAARYTLADMADDTAALIGELGLGPAHVVGASMGGMIAQMLAARHPQSVRSLVSIMSNTGSRRAGQPALRLWPMLLLRRPSRGRDAAIERTVRVFATIGSKGIPQDPDAVREMAALSYDRDHDPAAPGRQLAAILASGDRTAELRRIAVPTLVIHGTSDPLVRSSGAHATVRAISDARLQMIEGMGHDLPRAAWGQIIDGIEATALRADGASISA